MFLKSKRARSISYRAYDRYLPHPLLGIDEVGTGAIAGPIYAAGCILPRDNETLDALEKLKLQDSKQMTPISRSRVFDFLTSLVEIRYHIARKMPHEIEAMGQNEALASLFDEIVAWRYNEIGDEGATYIDGDPNHSVTFKNVHWLQKGDTRSLTIAAASVLAKVSRDSYLDAVAPLYPQYGFQNHHGYFTREHQEALLNHGPCDIHRRSTRPVQESMEALRRQSHVVSQTFCPVAVSLEKVR